MKIKHTARSNAVLQEFVDASENRIRDVVKSLGDEDKLSGFVWTAIRIELETMMDVGLRYGAGVDSELENSDDPA